jgi:murein L,D-transpeptidase YcbB/YkuD
MTRRLLACVLLLGAHLAAAAQESLWFQQGAPKPAALQALALLAAAPEDGLDPQDYDAAALTEALTHAALPESAAGIDARLTAAMQRYLGDLHGGRIDPRKVHAEFDLAPPSPFDPAAYLQAALAGQRLPQAAHEAAPALGLYTGLRRALASYRALEKSVVWQLPLAPLPRKKLLPGEDWAGTPALLQRLVALGDLAPDTPLPLNFEGALVEALKSFQARHGLEADGVIGMDTWQQLAVTPAARVRQIELTLERLRWTPLMAGSRMIVVNVPEFILRAYEIKDGRVEVRLESRIIVGTALKTGTPLFDERMRFIEFSPYWNVPPSIARKELVPRLRRQPGYFQHEGFEFVGHDGRVLTELSAAHLDAVLGGQLRLRQRPGVKNALGAIKFVFPNNDNIYLHDTSAPQLFNRVRRDFSHGCIRVEEPVALAKFVLQDDPEWSEQRIRDAITKGQSATVRLKETLPVVVAYSTVIVKGDKVHFLRDFYGHDRLLDQALRQHSAQLHAAPAPKAATR